MKKLLGGLRSRKTAADNNIPLTTETRIDVRRLSKKTSVRRRPQSAPRILDDYPTPPEALAPIDASKLPALPGMESLPPSLDPNNQYSDEPYPVGNHELLGDLDFGAFELPRERALPSVRHSAYGMDHHMPMMEHTPPDEAYIESRLSPERDHIAAGRPQSSGLLNVNAAVNLLENLRRTASPEELVVLQQALNSVEQVHPGTSPSPAPSHRPKSMAARIASQVARFEGAGPTSNPTGPPSWKAEMLGSSSLQKLEYLGDGSHQPKMLHVENHGQRSETPVDLDYSHIGSMTFGTLAITNGAPASPAHGAHKSVDLKLPDPRIPSALSLQSEEYFTPDEESGKPLVMDSEDDYIHGSRQGASSRNENSFLSQSQSSKRPQSRSESPLKNEVRTISDSTTNSTELEHLPESRVSHRFSKQTNEPVVKLAELIHADDESLDLDNSYLSKPDGFYTHSRNGSTHSAISLADEYKSDIPASPFEMESPTPNTGSFPNETNINIDGNMSRQDLMIDTSRGGSVPPQVPTMQSDSRPMTSRTMRNSELAEVADAVGLPRMPSIKSRPSQSQSDDSGYSSAHTSHGHDHLYDFENNLPRDGNFAMVGHESSSPIEVSMMSVDTSISQHDYAGPIYHKQESPVSKELTEGFVQYRMSPEKQHTRPVSPITADEANFLRQAPAPKSKLINPRMRPKSQHEQSFASSTSSVPLPNATRSKSIVSRSQNDLLNTSVLSKSVSSFGSNAAEQPKRAKSTDRRKKSLRNVFGLFKKSDKPEEKEKEAVKEKEKEKPKAGGLASLAGNKSANQSRVSVLSTKSDKTTGAKDGNRTPRKLQKKKSRPLTGYSNAPASKSEVVPTIPADLQRRFGDREGGANSGEATPTTIGMSYDAMQRSKTPMMLNGGNARGNENGSTTNFPKRPLPSVPGMDVSSTSLSQARPRPQETLSNGAKNPDKRFSLNRLRSKSSPQAVADDGPLSRASDDSIDEGDFPTGYFNSIPMVNGPDGFSGSPYDVAMMIQNGGNIQHSMPQRHSMMIPGDMPRVPPIPGRFSQYGPPQPQQQHARGPPGPRGFRPPPPGMGPGGPGSSSGSGSRGRPMSYHGVVRTASGPRRRMEVVGEGDEDGHGGVSTASATPPEEDSSLLEAGDSGAISRTPSTRSNRGEIGSLVRPKSEIGMAGMAVTSSGAESSPNLGYGPPSGNGFGPGPAGFHGGYPMRMASNGSTKRMSMPVHPGMHNHKSNPDLREEMKRNSTMGMPMNRMSQHGPPRSPRLDPSNYYGPPPPARTGSPRLDPNYFPAPRSPRLEPPNEFLATPNGRPVSRSSSIRSARSTGTQGPRPYPGSMGPSSRTPSMASMMMMDTINTHIGGGPYPTLPGRDERERIPDRTNPYAWQPRSSPRMDGPYPPMAPQQPQMRSHNNPAMGIGGRPRPKSAMMMGMMNTEMSSFGPYPPNHRDSYSGGSFRDGSYPPNRGQNRSPAPPRSPSMNSQSGDRWGPRPRSGYGQPGGPGQRPRSNHSQRPFSSAGRGGPPPIGMGSMGIGADLSPGGGDMIHGQA